MDFYTRKVLFFCYLLFSSYTISICKDIAVTDQIADEIADDFLQQFQKDIDVMAKNAPEDPDNDIDGEDQGRAFFLLPFLPKLAILLVKVAIKVAPLVVKAAVALKAKAVAATALAAAKVSSAAALKATALTVGKTILTEVATSAVVDVVTDKVTDYLSASNDETATDSGPEEEKPANIFDFYQMNSEVCQCTSNKQCACCVQPEEFEQGCLNVTLTESLWNVTSDIKIGAYYGGKEIMTRTMPIAESSRKCHSLSKPFTKVNMCVSTHSRKVGPRGKRVKKCFGLFFNVRGINKCISQGTRLKLRFVD